MNEQLAAAQAALAVGDVEGLASLLKADNGLAADDAGLLIGLVLPCRSCRDKLTDWS